MTNVKEKTEILIIDDDKFLLDMYAIKFGEYDFNVNTAFSSNEAMDKLKDGLTPSIILMDIVMPGMDGFELLKNIKDNKLAPQAKIIILSNIGQDEDIQKGKKLGADGYIVKASATPTEVVEKVKKIVNK